MTGPQRHQAKAEAVRPLVLAASSGIDFLPHTLGR